MSKNMAPLSITVDSVEDGQLLQDQAQCLALNLVTKYLRSVVKSDKLAIKFEEKISASIINLDSIGIKKENISIDDVLKKHLAKSKDDKGTASNLSIVSVLIYKYIQENSSEKVAKKNLPRK